MLKLVHHNHIGIHISNVAVIVTDCSIIVLKTRVFLLPPHLLFFPFSPPPLLLSSSSSSFLVTVLLSMIGFAMYFEIHPTNFPILSFNTLNSFSIASNLLQFISCDVLVYALHYYQSFYSLSNLNLLWEWWWIKVNVRI